VFTSTFAGRWRHQCSAASRVCCSPCSFLSCCWGLWDRSEQAERSQPQREQADPAIAVDPKITSRKKENIPAIGCLPAQCCYLTAEWAALPATTKSRDRQKRPGRGAHAPKNMPAYLVFRRGVVTTQNFVCSSVQFFLF
jgi:hypothetical protein